MVDLAYAAAMNSHRHTRMPPYRGVRLPQFGYNSVVPKKIIWPAHWCGQLNDCCLVLPKSVPQSVNKSDASGRREWQVGYEFHSKDIFHLPVCHKSYWLKERNRLRLSAGTSFKPKGLPMCHRQCYFREVLLRQQKSKEKQPLHSLEFRTLAEYLRLAEIEHKLEEIWEEREKQQPGYMKKSKSKRLWQKLNVSRWYEYA